MPVTTRTAHVGHVVLSVLGALTFGACGERSSTGDSWSDGGSGAAEQGGEMPPPDGSGGSVVDGGSSGSGRGNGGSSGDGGVPCKRGVATQMAPSLALAPTSTSAGVSWYYNWGVGPTAGADPQIEFNPMIWGSGSLPATIPSTSRYLLGFNEPNLSASGSADMTPQTAASYWPQVEALAKPLGIPIVSPAVNLCSGDCVGAPDPYTWLQDFFAACAGCEVDYIAVHFYGCSVPTQGQWIGLDPYLQNFYPFGKPIWLTEFSCDAGQTVNAQTSYMEAAVPYLESNPHVFRYSWFSATSIPNATLTQGNGTLTPLGSLYASLPESCR